MGFETIISIAALALSLVVSVISGVFTYRQAVVHDKKQDTLEAYNRLEAEALDPLDKIMPAEIRDIAQKSRSEKYKEVFSYMARIEHFCLGVEEKIYDFDIVYKLGHGYLDGRILNRMEPFLAKKSSGSEEGYFVNTNAVIKRMQRRSEKQKKKTAAAQKSELT